LVEVDLHFGRRDADKEYWDAMAEIRSIALKALEDAQRAGHRFVLFRHGSSTSSRGVTTARSQVRALMRSPDATPYIKRSECIQHYSVFVAAIRPASKQPTADNAAGLVAVAMRHKEEYEKRKRKNSSLK